MLLFPLRPIIVGATALTASSLLLSSPLLSRRPALLESVSAKDWSVPQYQREAATPIITSSPTESGSRLNPAAVRQISAGSITGVIAGLAISTFSRPLALIFGLFAAGVVFLESRGISLVPYKRIQGYVRGVDVRSLVQDNAAFKLSFGLTCALVGFTEF